MPDAASKTAAAYGFDPEDPAFVLDPYRVYAALREQAPVCWHEPNGLWLVSQHADVDALLRDRRLGRVFIPKEPDAFYGPWNLVNEHSMLELEPPDHTRLRRLVSREFTPRHVERLRGRIRGLTERMLEPLADTGEGDLMQVLAEPLPVAVIAELLAIPEQDRQRLRPWSNAIVSLYELSPDAEAADQAVRAAREFDAYLRELIAERRRRPGDDLLSGLAALSLEGDRLTEDELVATSVLLLNAGHEASVNVIGNGLLALLRHPEQVQCLRDDAGLVPGAVEEFIRYDSPLSLFQRTAFDDVEVAGQRVREGERVGLLLGSANRDPKVFAQPDAFDIRRSPNPHVGFGAGIHHCLGAPLARLEIQEALSVLLARFSVLELHDEPALRTTYQFRGYQTLRVRADMR
jgi:cytochrome P450